MSRTRTGSLTVAEQRQLAKLAARPDLPIAMKVRVKLLNYLDANFDLLTKAIEAQLIFGHRDYAPATQLLISLLDRLLPQQREVVSWSNREEEEQGPQMTGVVINVHGVARGTKAARDEAITITAEKRAAFQLPAAS